MAVIYLWFQKNNQKDKIIKKILQDYKNVIQMLKKLKLYNNHVEHYKNK